MNAIELTHVCKAFPGFAIQDLSLAVPSGTICGLVGENGAGKTTAIRLMLGALRPDSGRCTLLGVDADSPQILAAKEDVGVVLDEPSRWERSFPRPTAAGTRTAMTATWTASPSPGTNSSKTSPGA